MKKNFKLMLLGLLALGGSSAFAQTSVNDVFTYGNYQYQVTKVNSNKSGEVKVIAIAEGKEEADFINAQGVLDFPATATPELAPAYEYAVTEMAADLFKDKAYTAKSVTIPSGLKEIPTGAFNTLTRLSTIQFAENSQVTKIGSQAFASTQITEFDFTNCIKLEELDDEVFIQQNDDATNVNTFITKVTLPTSPLFKHINGAFRNLPNLETIENLENSWITEIVAEAFSGDEKLTELKLPKEVKWIDAAALKGSAVETLEVDVTKLLWLGGGTVKKDDNATSYLNKYTFEASDEAVTTNIYGLGGEEDDAAPLKNLILKGELQGKIATNAFLNCTGLSTDEGFDLDLLTYGTQAQIQSSAFEGCTGITSLTINEIKDNQLGNEEYTIAADAFKGTNIARLNIKGVTTANAIGKAAFGNVLEDVTIGTVKAGAAAFEAGAFVWGDVNAATLALATGEGKYVSNDTPDGDDNEVIPAGAFDFSAVGKETRITTNPVVTIGEIKSQGGVFAEGALIGKLIEEIHFTGDINTNGLNVAILSTGSDEEEIENTITTLIFDGAIKANGIGEGAFADLATLTTITFNGELAEGAVASGAFTADDLTDADVLTVEYTVENIDDYTVNPFASDAFGGADDTRVIAWSVADYRLAGSIHAAIQAAVEGEEYEGDVVDTKFNVYKWLADATEPEPEAEQGFLVFRNQNEPNIAWGRYDLGSFTAEKGKYATSTTNADGETEWENAYEATNMLIPRYQETEEGNVKITLYGIYTDEDDLAKVSSTYLVPLYVQDGAYLIPEDNEALIIVKAENLDGEFSEEGKDVLIKYETTDADGDDLSFDGDGALTSSVWAQLADADGYTKADESWTNQELWDVVKKSDNNVEVAGKDLWIMSDPAKYNGFRIDKNEIEKGGAFIGLNWYYTLLNNYGDATAAARVVWLDEAQATAIFGVKTVNAAAQDDAIYNLQGIRVSNPTKAGIYIQNGKKFIVK